MPQPKILSPGDPELYPTKKIGDFSRGGPGFATPKIGIFRRMGFCSASGCALTRTRYLNKIISPLRSKSILPFLEKSHIYGGFS